MAKDPSVTKNQELIDLREGHLIHQPPYASLPTFYKFLAVLRAAARLWFSFQLSLGTNQVASQKGYAGGNPKVMGVVCTSLVFRLIAGMGFSVPSKATQSESDSC